MNRRTALILAASAVRAATVELIDALARHPVLFTTYTSGTTPVVSLMGDVVEQVKRM